jgi:hypothetical protein
MKTENTRATGVVWLVYFVVAILGAVVTRGLVVRGDAAATAANIVAHQNLYQAGVSLDLLGNVLYLVLTALLYGLFRRVDRRAALIAALLGFAGCVVQIVGELVRLAPSVILTNAQLGDAFSVHQLQSAALFSIALYAHVFDISFVLFAFFWVAIGFLILKSSFLPKWLGWWWVIGGAAWLLWLWPPLGRLLQPAILVVGLAELVFAVWLLVKGVDSSAQAAGTDT